MRQLCQAVMAGGLLALIVTMPVQGQTPLNQFSTGQFSTGQFGAGQFSTGFTPRDLRFVPMDTGRAMKQFKMNSTFVHSSMTSTRAFNLSSMIPTINLGGFGTRRAPASTFIPQSQNPLQQRVVLSEEKK